jgi:hypothetical protein
VEFEIYFLKLVIPRFLTIFVLSLIPDNPCPHLGNIVTIKLSENQENVLQSDESSQTMTVETHFQMNYNTGEWKRIKKLRKLEDSGVIQVVSHVKPPVASPVTSTQAI